jgi:hypothetical protein
MIFVHSQSQEISSGEVSLLVHISEKCDGIISFSQSCEFFVRSFRVLEISAGGNGRYSQEIIGNRLGTVLAILRGTRGTIKAGEPCIKKY